MRKACDKSNTGLFRIIDFHGGHITFIEDIGEDMIIVEYPHGYSVDVGYIESESQYYVTVILNGIWNPYIKQTSASTKEEMLQELQKAIEYILRINKKTGQ